MVRSQTKTLVVGCGSIGQRHARLLGERRDVELWVCDGRREALDEARTASGAARGFAVFEEALQAGPDLVFVCTPNHLHRPMSVQALEAGCDVFCEKPLAENLESARALSGVVQKSERFFQVGYMWRSYDPIRQMARMSAEGKLGNLVGGRAMIGSYRTLMTAKTPYRLHEENALIIDNTHTLDYSALLFGELESVQAESATLGRLEMMPKPNLFSLILRYRSGAMVQCHIDYIQHPQRHILELYGDRGTAVHDFMTGETRVFDREKEDFSVDYFRMGRDDLYRGQIDALLAAIRGDRVPLVNADDGVAALEAAQAAIISAQEGRLVSLDELRK